MRSDDAIRTAIELADDLAGLMRDVDSDCADEYRRGQRRGYIDASVMIRRAFGLPRGVFEAENVEDEQRVTIEDGDWSAVAASLEMVGMPGKWGVLVRKRYQNHPTIARESWPWPFQPGCPDTFDSCPTEATLREAMADVRAMVAQKEPRSDHRIR